MHFFLFEHKKSKISFPQNRDDSETDSASEEEEEEEEEDGQGDDNDSDTDPDDGDDGEPAASPARDEEPLLSCSALLVSAKDIVIFLFFLAALYYGLVWGAVQLARLAEELFFAPYGSVLLRHHKDSSAGADSAGGGGEPQVMREEL